MKKIYSFYLMLGITFSAQAQFDTTGISDWNSLHNSHMTWMQGAFDANRDTADDFDFGWGSYDMNTHHILGDSIYIIKTVNGNYKAISIDRLVSGIYTIIYSDLDGSNIKTVDLDRSPYNSKNFFRYSLDDEETKDLEPATADWDIVFTKYETFITGANMYYAVAGALHNRGVEVSEVHFEQGGSYDLTDTVDFPFSSDISTIGYEWKSAGPGGTVIHDTVIYYVKDQSGNINELQFTGYGGSGTGSMKFMVNGVEDSVSLGSGNVNQVYYSLEDQAIVGENLDHNWDIALLAQSSVSSLPVRINSINGAELYIYPNEDISYWTYLGVDESEQLNVVSVYPNPARDKVNIVLNAAQSDNAEIAILDQNGKMVRSQGLEILSGMAEYPVNTQGLPQGFYFLHVNGETYQGIHKLVIR